jgi:hypothetical protein
MMAGIQGIEGLERMATLVAQRPEQIRKAARLAQSRAAKKAKTLASRRIREKVALKKAYVDDKLRIKWDGDVVSLEATKRGVLLSRYAHRPAQRGGKPAGYRIKLAARGGTVHFKHVFPVPLRRGTRTGSDYGLAQRAPGAGRYPIEVLHAPSVSQELAWELENLGRSVVPVHEKEFLRQVERIK